MHQKVSTGVSGLDSILRGGLPRHHLYLVEGDPGAGKTTLALQFLLDGRDRGERVLYCTLSETQAEVAKVADSHGWEPDGIMILEMGSSLNAVNGEDSYTVFRPSDIELGETTKKLLERVDEFKPDRVAIDSLSELRLLAQEPLRYRRQILGLKHYFSEKKCTVLLLDDRAMQSSELQPQSIAHGVIELNRVPTEYGAERRRLRVVKLGGLAFTGGYHDYTIETGGLAVFPRISYSHEDSRFEDDTTSTGMPELDELLGGGLDRGTSTLITGPAGTGKSTLAMSLVDAAAARGDRAAIFAFEEGLRMVLRRTKSLGMPFDDYMARGLVTHRSFVPAELSPGDFTSRVRQAVESDGARVVVIDSLNGYLNSMPEERFLAPQMHELLGYLNSRGVVSILILAQRGMMGPGMHAAVDVSYLADTVLMLRHFEAFGSVRKAVSVLKKRTGTHENSIRELIFEVDGVRVGAALSDFRGILTGVPTYVGTEHRLFNGGNGHGGG
jgi:circadian clock protein KaiC